MIVSGTKGKDVRRLNPAEMQLGQGDSYAALRGRNPKQNHSIKGELVPLATSVVQKCKMGEMDEELTCGITSNSIALSMQSGCTKQKTPEDWRQQRRLLQKTSGFRGVIFRWRKLLGIQKMRARSSISNTQVLIQQGKPLEGKQMRIYQRKWCKHIRGWPYYNVATT